MNGLSTFFFSFVILSITTWALVVGQDLIIPFVIACGIWYIILALSNAIKQIPKIGPILPSWLLKALSIVICLYALWFLVSLLTHNITSIAAAVPEYEEKFHRLIQRAQQQFHIKSSPDLKPMFQSIDFVNLATISLQAATSLASNLGLIIIYVLFLLMEYHTFDAKIQALFKREEKAKEAKELIQQISFQIQSYILIKTILSVATALLSYAVFIAIGIDFAPFWALLIFLLNYIPTIGSIIATLFPSFLTLVQFESITPFVFTLILLTSIQFIIGNLIEPKIIGKSVNLSGLIIILSLAFWGKIWGIPGMFLCVPIMVSINIILANFSYTRPLSILLSEKP